MKTVRGNRHMTFESLSSRTCFSFGDLDSSFGDEGKIVFAQEDSSRRFNLLLESFEVDDGYLQLVRSYNQFDSAIAVTKVKLDGSRDQGFGVGGVIYVPTPKLAVSVRTAVRLIDGTCLVLVDPGKSREISEYGLLALKTDGTIQRSFGTEGVLWLDNLLGSSPTFFAAADGGFYLHQFSVSMQTAVLSKFDANGKLDSSFANGGLQSVSERIGSNVLLDVDSEGRLVLSSAQALDKSRHAQFRLLSNGQVDTSFGINGLVLSESDAVFNSVITPVPGKQRYFSYRTATDELGAKVVQVRKTKIDEKLDLEFGQDGTTTFELPGAGAGESVSLRAVASPGGELYLLAEQSPAFEKYNLWLVKLSSSGLLDPAYGQNGIAFSTLDRSIQWTDMDITKYGGILLAGETLWEFDRVNLMFLPNGLRDPNFGPQGLSIENYSRVALQSQRVELLSQSSANIGVLSGWNPSSIETDFLVGQSLQFDSSGKPISNFPFQMGKTGASVLPNGQGGWYQVVEYDTGMGQLEIRIKKFFADGNADKSFANRGNLVLSYPPLTQWIASSTSDGTIWLLGSLKSSTGKVEPQATIRKITADGQIDNTFGNQGVLTVFASSYIQGVVGNRSDQIVVLAMKPEKTTPSQYPELQAFNRFGQPITKFGQLGVSILSIDNFHYVDAILDEFQRVLVVYRSEEGYKLIRLTVEGKLDPSFGENGSVVLPITGDDWKRKVKVVSHEGVIAVWGTQATGNGSVARLSAFDYLGRKLSLGPNDYRDYAFNATNAELRDVIFANDGDLIASSVEFDGVDQRGYVFRIQSAEPIGLHNWRAPLDVTGNEIVSPTDALQIINFLNSRDPGDSLPNSNQYLMDVNYDFRVTPSDALLIINFLNSRINGEGESDATTVQMYGLDIEELAAKKLKRA